MSQLVSIIIPVYNVEKYISKCLESVINQTYKNIEIITMIDGSKDGSERIARQYAMKDERIKVIKKENEGLLKTRVRGLEYATGKFVMNLDSDDWIESDMIEKLMNVQEKYNADLVRARGIRELIDGKIKRKMPGPFKSETVIDREDFKENLYPILLNTYYCNSIWGQIIRRDIIDTEQLDTNIVMGEDLNFNIEIYKNIDRIVFLPDCFYHYRYNSSSITKNIEIDYVYNKAQDIAKVYYKLFNALKNWNIESEKNKKIVAIRILKEVNNIVIQFFKEKNDTVVKEYIQKVSKFYEITSCKEYINFDDLRNEKTQLKKFYKAMYSGEINEYMSYSKRRQYKIKFKNLIIKKILNIYQKKMGEKMKKVKKFEPKATDKKFK